MPLPVRGVPLTLLLLSLHTCPSKLMVSFCSEVIFVMVSFCGEVILVMVLFCGEITLVL